MIRELRMKSELLTGITDKMVVVFLAAAFLAIHPAMAQESSKAAQTAAAAKPAQKSFATPEEAAQALIKAAEEFNLPNLLEILGPDGEPLVSSKDPVEDKNHSLAFAARAKEKNSVAKDSSNANRAILTVGNEDWPMPIPIVKRSGKWIFDSRAGRDEVINRRIGSNELNAIQVLRGFVEAQMEYAADVHDKSGLNQYAQKLLSSPGKQDGLTGRIPMERRADRSARVSPKPSRRATP